MNFLLQENGDFLLQENGFFIIIEFIIQSVLANISSATWHEFNSHWYAE